MYVTVQLAPEFAQAREIARLAEDIGVSFRALHPDSDDPALATYFVVEVPDSGAAQNIVTRLRHSSAVRAAYIKPPDAPA